MNEQASGRAPGPFVRVTVTRARRLPQELHAALAWGSAGVATVLIGLYFWLAEGGFGDSIFAVAVTLAVGALIVWVGHRVLVAAVLVVAMVGIVRAISYAKQQATEVLLHAYDLIALMRSWSTLAEVWSQHHRLVVALAVAAFATVAVSWIAVRADGTRVPRHYAAYAFVLLAAIAWVADTARGERRHTEFYFENIYVTFFYSSWGETVRALWRGQLIEAAAPRSVLPKEAPLHVAESCYLPARAPHIILIHQESVVPPALFPTLSHDPTLDSFFQSLDGSFNKLRVETFGGGSWLTEFSLLTGLSAQSFGSMRQYLQHVMAGGIHDTLPQALARCGYRNVMFYPMLRHFLGSGRFFEAVGIREIFDAKAQQAKLANERDRFYYTNALAEIGRHLETSAQPLFLYIQTMAAHGPYDYTYSPDVVVPGGGPGTAPTISEYLRRLGMARMDYAYLRSELLRRFPRQAFLIVHYGDHQPTATRSLLGFGDSASIEDVMASGNEAARMTYYALDAIRYRPPPLPNVDVLDVAYLGTMVLEAAGIPLSDPYRERTRLMLLCKGRYHDCAAREEVLRFHRRLIDSGLMKPL
jgi:phosphoglycerol transferase MdoB-like AlkP superfamily enzyme